MTKKQGILQAGRHRAQSETVQELRDLFRPWLNLPGDFGKGAYDRLFSPLTHLLALPLAGLGRGRQLPGDTQEVPRLAGTREEEDGVAQYGGLL